VRAAGGWPGAEAGGSAPFLQGSPSGDALGMTFPSALSLPGVRKSPSWTVPRCQLGAGCGAPQQAEQGGFWRGSHRGVPRRRCASQPAFWMLVSELPALRLSSPPGTPSCGVRGQALPGHQPGSHGSLSPPQPHQVLPRVSPGARLLFPLLTPVPRGLPVLPARRAPRQHLLHARLRAREPTLGAGGQAALVPQRGHLPAPRLEGTPQVRPARRPALAAGSREAADLPGRGGCSLGVSAADVSAAPLPLRAPLAQPGLLQPGAGVLPDPLAQHPLRAAAAPGRGDLR